MVKVKPQIGNNKFQKINNGFCFDVPIPELEKNIGVPDSDLHMFIKVAEDDKKINFSKSNYCSLDENYKRPNFGIMVFNTNHIEEF